MALESPVTTIYDLVATNPPVGDPVSQADDHLRNIKTALLASFAGTAASPGSQQIGKFILKMGQGTTNASGVATITYPVAAFPTSVVAAFATLGTNVAGTTTIIGVDGSSLSQLVVHASTPAGANAAVGFYWLAIGF